MSAQLAEIYDALPDQAKQEAMDFLIFLNEKWNTGKPDQKTKPSDAIMAAFREAEVNVPVTWTREDIHDRF